MDKKRIRRLSWDDALVMGALSFGYEFFMRQEAQKSPEERATEAQRRRETEQKVMRQQRAEDKLEEGDYKPPERSKEDKKALRDAAKEVMREAAKEKDAKKGNKRPMVDGGGTPYDSYKGMGNKPGYLVNAFKPDTLPMELRRRKGGNMRRRKEVEGAVPVAWHRFPIDGKVFGGSLTKGKLKSRGSVLVDLSGSMNWGMSEIETMLDYLPEGSAYGYSGGGHASGPKQGRWILLADRGKAVPAELISDWRIYSGFNNLVDLPCLAMLANMPKPRIWISDGQVTGIHGFDYELESRAMKFCKEHDIVAVYNAQKLKQYMTTGQTPAFNPF